MDILKGTVIFYLFCLSSEAVVNCLTCDPDVMTDDELAMCIIGESFVTTTTSTGGTESIFGELRLDNMEEALMAYQRLHSIAVTGKADRRTIEEMVKPRCGVKDMKTRYQNTRRKRFATQGNKWDNSSPLTYRFINYTPDLPRGTTRRVIAASFQMWSAVTNLEFREVTSTPVDIEILFASGEHGDGAASAFDGRGGTLAHAYFPSTSLIGGDCHFDEDEPLSDGENRGINLFQVAVHEFGHSLGLHHSNVRGSIMFPSYNGYVPGFQLHDDDILGIQSLYGRKTAPATTTTTTRRPNTQAPTRPTNAPTRPTNAPTRPTQAPTRPTQAPTRPTQPTSPTDRAIFCRDGNFDAITSFRGITYVFKGDMYAVLTASGMASGYPQRISSKFAGLSGNVDAVLTWETHAVPRFYVFKGSQFWKYDRNLQPVPGYPRSISVGFPGLPNDIDAAFVWGRNARTYVFKNGVYYRLQGVGSDARGNIDSGYPRSQSEWRVYNELGDIRSVFRWNVNDRTYMFNGDRYIRFNDQSISVDSSSVPYPRDIPDWWLRCASGSLETDHPAEMEQSADMKDEFVVIPQADDDDHFESISGATVPRQGALLDLVLLVTIRMWFSC